MQVRNNTDIKDLGVEVLKQKKIKQNTYYLCKNLDMYSVLVFDNDLLKDSICYLEYIEALHEYNRRKRNGQR